MYLGKWYSVNKGEDIYHWGLDDETHISAYLNVFQDSDGEHVLNYTVYIGTLLVATVNSYKELKDVIEKMENRK